jgi:hypothetical protein
METEKERKYLKIYQFGAGFISVQSGRMSFLDKETNEEKHRFPFIDLSVLEDKKDVGEDLDLHPKSEDYVKLLFANIESLEVFQRALDFCREELELQNNKIIE